MATITVSAVNNRAPPFARSKLPVQVQISSADTVEDVKKKIAAKIPKFYASRQKLVLKSENKALADDTKLEEIGLAKGGDLEIKDLGPQAGWRTVYIIEYLGPLIIHPLIYNFPQVFFGKEIVHSNLQKFTVVMASLHFTKRLLESIFVHRFSHGTMPFFNIFKNSGHYWVLSGVLLAYDVYRPSYAANGPYIKGTQKDDENYLWIFASIWALFQFLNFSAHWTLRNLRPAGTRKRAIPYGIGFSLVSCPNYFFESMAWLTISVMTGSYAAYFFTAVSTAQMLSWASKRHRAYKKEFGKEYPRNRKAMIPFVF
ncbi:Very-long-chain enoyl-CoA reductase [Marasmius crinis-equi]|uniref:very-long-chain enoyl-CoA reductase n=1 Tax=Marasmius crinis-equi TaxID=585013 RepID=A0ABR3FWJ0_9AGAR